MGQGGRTAIAGVRWLDEIAAPSSETPEYVGPQVAERLGQLRQLPLRAGKILSDCEGVIVDLGPGEGVSSMALAQFAPKAQVVGLEADLLHLLGAWPMCRKYENLRLGWGAVAGTLSNGNVNPGKEAVPTAALGPAGCDVLFSWAGMSRIDVYESSAAWAESVGRACVLVLPEFWRRGVGSLPDAAQAALRDVCARAGAREPSWAGATALPGFSGFESWPTDQTLRARGWLLWLSGLFDGTSVSFLDTLRDRRAPEPRFQLEFELPLEVVVATK
mgnify:CR=1 FL=1